MIKAIIIFGILGAITAIDYCCIRINRKNEDLQMKIERNFFCADKIEKGYCPRIEKSGCEWWDVCDLPVEE